MADTEESLHWTATLLSRTSYLIASLPHDSVFWTIPNFGPMP
jgi:hypothetical protein